MRATLRILIYLTVIATGAVLALHLTRPDLVDVYLIGWQWQMTQASVAAIFLLGPCFLLLRWVRVHRRARDIGYATENGRVTVSLIAIEEALTRALEGESCVKKAHVRVCEDRVKHQVIIDVVLTLWEVPNITEHNRACERLLRRRFAELMPEQSVVQVNLSVHRFAQRREDARRATEARAPASIPAIAPPAAAAEPGTESDAAGSRAPAGPGASPGPDGGSALGAFVFGAESTPPRSSSEEDLYVGPSYPVETDDEDVAGVKAYLSEPVAPRKAPDKAFERSRTGERKP